MTMNSEQIAGAAHFSSDMLHLGFPAYFLPFQGVWKILGAIAILAPGLPRLEEWAYPSQADSER